MWNYKRIEMCGNCKNSERTYDVDAYHEMCLAGHCIWCFQTEAIDCDDFERKVCLDDNKRET